MNRDTVSRIRDIGLGDRFEKLSSVEMVQSTRAIRYPKAGATAHLAYCAENAPNDRNIIKCYLDEDYSPAQWENGEHTYKVKDVVEGTDSKAYICIKEHQSSVENKPITGENYATFWELAEIEVVCITTSGGFLAAMQPLLTKHQKILVTKIDDIWHCIWWFRASVICEI
jgi:hypothetical protein